MAKLKITPEKVSVVTKAITMSGPGKTKGGVPLEPKARLKFYEDEIERHRALKSKYPLVTDEKGKLTPQGQENAKKLKQIESQQDFLLKQLTSFKNEQRLSGEKMSEKAKQLKVEKERSARPFLQKAKEAIKDLGGSGTSTL